MTQNSINVTASTGAPIKVNVTAPSSQGAVTLSQDTSAYNAEIARQWAISDKMVLQEDYSSKYYATKAKYSENSAKNYANVAETAYNNIQDSANGVIADIETARVDAVNNVNTAINTGVERLNSIDALNRSQITNCILGIPQNIKLELNNGTLTLKAGSKITVPNGSNKFDEVLISTNRTITNTSNDTYLVSVTSNGSSMLLSRLKTQTGSGASTPTSGYWAYYNTTDNKVYRINNGTVAYQISFPIAIVTVTNGAISSIDQVFNGFGFIGNTIFCNKGVKGLIPNGRNTDGTLKNIEFTLPSVIVSTLTGSHRTMFAIGQAANGGYFLYRGTDAICKYDEVKNINIDTSKNEQWNILVVGSTTGDIDTMDKRPIFQAISLENVDGLQEEVSTKVNKTGDTMTGALVIQTNAVGRSVSAKVPVDLTVRPASASYYQIGFSDKNGRRVGDVEYSHAVAGNRMGLVVRNNDNTAYGGIYVSFDSNNKQITQAPTPAVGDNSTKIATTAYCVNMATTTKATTNSSASNTRPAWIVQNYVNGASWYRVWSDGWIEQGGYYEGSEYLTITLLKSFANTNYNILISSNASFNERTTTSFSLDSNYGNGSKPYGYWYACGY